MGAISKTKNCFPMENDTFSRTEMRLMESSHVHFFSLPVYNHVTAELSIILSGIKSYVTLIFFSLAGNGPCKKHFTTVGLSSLDIYDGRRE